MPPKSKPKYEQLDPISHILKRQDMYTGSARLRETEEYIAGEGFTITKKTMKSSPAILRIFIEILSNAIDNANRSRPGDTPSTKIKVDIDKETGVTSVWNDGDVVPIEINEEQECYNHTMIFGRLLTGSNYDDEEEREVAGRNGLGSKLCNVFSTEFTVEGLDPENGRTFKQTWTNNMRDTTGPVTGDTTLRKGYTKITWKPDFKRFGLKAYTKDIIRLYIRHVIDAAMISKITVIFNDVTIPVNSLGKYSALYNVPTDEQITFKHGGCEVLLTPSTEFEVISFVNGVFTKLGGRHVDSWSESIFRPIVDKFNKTGGKSSKTPKININDVKQFFRLFVVATVIRPEFDGQDKNKLESPNVESKVVQKQTNEILKWSVIEYIEDVIRSKEMSVLKKSERTKSRVKIDGYDPANNAGGKNSSECTLIVCEGLSAKTYAVAGIQQGVYGKAGRDWYGILPLTGKILNVRNATPSVIAANRVVTNLIQAIGIRHGVDYTIESNFKTLNYGKLMVMTDADVDGLHIEGLLLNLIHSLFPTMFKRESPFVVSMKTPIARVKNRGKKDILFYDERRFNEWVVKGEPGKVKYYKGLGTTKTEDVPDTFGLKMVEYADDIKTTVNMNKVFHKSHADSRKEWLAGYAPSNNKFSLDDQKEFTSMDVSQFIDGELIKFSHADCARSIPNVIDGLKESQRKILYSVMKRGLKFSGTSLKVAQLSGYTAEHSNYHHGEQNLQDTIVGMASDFVGSNNIPILYRDGQFGSRLDGGADAASARYIFTKMDMLTEYIFRAEDTPILKQVNDDGDLVQPEFYAPIIPMALVNGCIGIATGWSSSIPCYNPMDLARAIRAWLKNTPSEPLVAEKKNDEYITPGSPFKKFTPWYRGFNGKIESSSNGKFVTTGIINRVKGKENQLEVTELPVGLSTNKFKDMLEDLLQSKYIKGVKNYSTPSTVSFRIIEDDQGLLCTEKNLKMTSSLHTSNMVLFDENDQIRRFRTVDQIVDSFCRVRLKLYVDRKKHQIKGLEEKIKHLSNKMRFLKMVTSKELEIMNIGEDQIVSQLMKLQFDKENDSYDYLFRMQVRTFSKEKVAALESEIADDRETLTVLVATEESAMWLNELDEFEKQYAKFLKVMK
jgi:DNA topoisomerase II